MSKPRVVLDGLWRCLCPAVDQATAARVFAASPVLHSSSSPALRRSNSRSTPTTTTTTCSRNPLLQRTAQSRRYTTTAAPNPASAGISKHKTAPDGNSQLQKDQEVSELLASLEQSSTDAILEELDALQDKPENFRNVAAIIEYLIQERNLEPSVRLYECLMASARDTNASANMVAQLIAEMKERRLPMRALFCHDALAALAVHPNYMLRNEVLSIMRDSWAVVTLEGDVNIALGLLRDGQYEMAYSKIEDMLHRSRDSGAAPPPSWVLDIFIFVFAREGFLDEAVRFALDRSSHLALNKGPLDAVSSGTLPAAAARKGAASRAAQHDVSIELWHLLLEKCAKASHYEGTRYIWARTSEGSGASRDRISDGTLLDILNTAARNGDPELASETTKAISSRGTKLAMHHYEAIIESNAVTGNIEAALRVACIMHGALEVAPDPALRSIYLAIRNAYQEQQKLQRREPTATRTRASVIDDVLEAMTRLRVEYKIPREMFSLLIESIVDTEGFDRAYEVFTNSSKYLSTPIDYHRVLRSLLKECNNVSALRALVAENPRAAFKAGRSTVLKAASFIARGGDLDLAYEIFSMSREPVAAGEGTRPAQVDADVESSLWFTGPNVRDLVLSFAQAQDDRVFEIVDEAAARGFDTRRIVPEFHQGEDGEGVVAEKA